MTQSGRRSRIVRVRFLPSDREVEMPTGAYLTAAAAQAGVRIVHDCDGQGVCGTCRVMVAEGGEKLSPLDPREREQLGAEVDRGWRLCCVVRILGDAVVRVPEGGFAYPPEMQRGGTA